MWLYVLVALGLGYALQKLFFTKKRVVLPFVKRAAGALPILGHAKEFDVETCMTTFKEYPIKYGKFVEFFLGPIRSVLVSDVEIAREILMKRPKKFVRMTMMNYAAEQLQILHALFHAEGAVWSRVRKSTTPSFSNLNLTNKFSLMVSEMFSWMDRMNGQLKETPKMTFDMKYECFTLTIRVVSIIAFGLTETDAVCSYFYSSQCLQDIQRIFKFMGESATWGLPRFLWKIFMYKYEQEGLEAGIRFDLNCHKVINYKRELLKKNQKKDYSMIDSLLVNEANATEKALSDEEIVSNVKIFYLAGTDTTAVTMTWACYYFALYPKYCEQLRQEVKDVLFQNQDPMVNRAQLIQSIDIAKIKDMKLANAIVKETLRLSSPAPAMGFEPANGEPAELSNGIVIEPGDMVWVNQDGIHQDPEVFENPFEYLPERWLTEDPVKLNKMESHFLPFGYGTRVCPGMNLALHEAALAVSFLAYFFDMALDCPVDEIKRIANFVAIANKMPVRMTPAKNI
jgi:cytochrome P450